MMLTRDSAAIMAVVFAGAALSGCGSSQFEPPEGVVQIDVESLYEGDDLRVIQLTLRAHGNCSVKLGGAGGSETIAVEADRATGIAQCTALILADLVKTPAGNSVKWLHRLESDAGRAGGPETLYNVDADTLDDLLTMRFEPGVFPLDSPIRVAEFRDRTLWLQAGNAARLEEPFPPESEGRAGP